MSTASSGLSSLSTYVPLAGATGLDGATMLFAAAAAYTVLANCDAKEMKCENPTAVAAAGSLPRSSSAKERLPIDLGLGKMNGQNMLLGGLVAYAFVAIRQAKSVLAEVHRGDHRQSGPTERRSIGHGIHRCRRVGRCDDEVKKSIWSPFFLSVLRHAFTMPLMKNPIT